MSEQTILQAAQEAAKELNGKFEKKGDVFCLNALIAERKAFLSKQSLWYTARFKVDEASRQVTFTEMLEERKSGLGSGDLEDSPSGFSFKKTVTKSGTEGLEGIIDEQSVLFGKKYSYSLDLKKVREGIKRAAEVEGYSFKYSIWGKL
ncbi:hypothetical protein TheveDRAFT_1196 [Thermanaerovibrio velox DSM 12556]|uniref:Uncharacterized protein n=1 Tax=Thermanaerovibrio velox DSM 12556 TaxID=926567 RepID=H0USM9_9BACT|nr:hypothetical protein [Thermanaerovibrio velox]EHM10318.1 hypothetical protein TheveDRAFT_1196 [Thermanaerovibrio velox DSM 12556]